MPNFNLLRVRHRHAILSECEAHNLYERANLELLSEGVVKHEDCLALGLVGDPLQHEVQFLIDFHICDVNIPLNLLQALCRIKAGFGIHPDLDNVALIDVTLVGSNYDLRVCCCPSGIHDALLLVSVKNVSVEALVAELGAIKTCKASSAIIIAMLARLHHKVRRHDELHVSIRFQFFFRNLKLAQQFFAVFKNGLTVHAVEALRETESKVRSCHRLKAVRARQAVSEAQAVLATCRAWQASVGVV